MIRAFDSLSNGRLAAARRHQNVAMRNRLASHGATRRLGSFISGDSGLFWFGLAFVGFFLRRPGSLTHAEFAYEDGRIFYLGSWFGGPLDQLFRPYAGYVHLIPRSTGLLERLVPPAWAPFVSNFIALAIAALVVRFLASDRLATAVTDRRIRWACAVLFIVLPGMDMVLGSITFIQFYLAVFLVAGALASPARTIFGAITFRLALVIVSLTGPFSLLFAPMYVARAAIRRDRDSLWSLVAVGIGAAVQFVALLVAGGRGAAEPTLAPVDVIRVVGVHIATGFTGTRFMIELVARQPTAVVAIIAILILAALVLVALRSVPRGWLVVGGYVLAVTIGSSLLNGSDKTADLLDPNSVSRYFVLPWFVVGVFLIASASRRNLAAIVLLCVLAVGIVGDFRLPSGWDYHWSEDAACIGGPDPCPLCRARGTSRSASIGIAARSGGAPPEWQGRPAADPPATPERAAGGVRAGGSRVRRTPFGADRPAAVRSDPRRRVRRRRHRDHASRPHASGQSLPRVRR
jgi:hypothetical protein